MLSQEMKIAKYYFNKGDNYKSMQLLDYIMRNDYSSSFEAILMMCELFVREEQYDTAERILKQLISIKGVSGRAFFNYGNILLIRGEYSGAGKQYDRAIKNGYISARLLLNYEEASCQQIDGMQFLEKKRNSIEKPLYYKILGDLFLYKTNFEEALKAYRESGKYKNSGLLNVALIYFIHEKIEDSAEILKYLYEQTSKEDIFHYDVQFILSVIDQRNDNKEGVTNKFIEEIMENIDNIENPFTVMHIYVLLILCHAKMKKYAEMLILVDDFTEIVAESEVSKALKAILIDLINGMDHGIHQDLVSKMDIFSNETDEQVLQLFMEYIKDIDILENS